MADDIAIKVENVSKTFKLPHEKTTSIKSAVVNFYKRNKSYEKQQVLKDISFEVKKGEFFGIVGRNGSGKSTLLKHLAGIYTPSEGTITVNGKLTPFIELGVGFNHELSGRENVFLNGALLGFNRSEMEGMYDEIVKFAELERFMDQKLKNYSSGMQVRLAFSIAIRAKSDILLIDEVLAVGDAAFQAKCFDYFWKLKKQKQTIVFVTHDMGSVKQFCDRALMLDQGRISIIGAPAKVTLEYAIENSPDMANEKNLKTGSPKKHRDQDVVIESIQLGNGLKNDNHFSAEDVINVLVKYEVKKNRGIFVAMSFTKLDDRYLSGFNSKGNLGKIVAHKGKNEAVCTLPAKQLAQGTYYLNIAIADYETGALIDYVDHSSGMETPMVYVLESDPYRDGEFNLEARWDNS